MQEIAIFSYTSITAASQLRQHFGLC